MKKLIPSLAILACTSFATADVIWDQIGAMDGSNLDGSIGASQAFEEAFGIYNIVAMDDFSVDAATDLNSVSAILNGWNGYAGPAGVLGYYVHVYSSPEAAGADLAGDVISIYLDAAAGDPGISYNADWAGSGDMVTLDLSGFSLDAGSYMIAVQANNEFGGNGQTGIMSSDLGNSDGWQANPAGGFGFGGLQQTGNNYAYSIDGSAIPAPGALALIGLAGLASRRRRK